MNTTDSERRFFTANDIMQQLQVSSSKAYSVIRKLNAELEAKGYLTVSGRISKTYFFKRYHADEDEMLSA